MKQLDVTSWVQTVIDFAYADRRRQKQVAVAMLPWGVSAALHVTLIVLAVSVIWVQLTRPPEPITVPMLQLGKQTGTPLKIHQQTRLTEQLKQVPRERTLTPEVTEREPLLDVQLLTAEGAADDFSLLTPSMQARRLAVQPQSQAEFRADFLGTGGDARRIVFLIDASGSLIDTLPFVLRELQDSVRKLSSGQQFAVIFFQGDRVIEVPPEGMKSASVSHKQAVLDWLNPERNTIRAVGRSNPLRALQRAMAYRPELVFLLSDNIVGTAAREIDPARLLTEIAQLNTSNARINTIQFLYPDPTAEAGQAGTMQRIAQQSGGVYRFVDQGEVRVD